MSTVRAVICRRIQNLHTFLYRELGQDRTLCLKIHTLVDCSEAMAGAFVDGVQIFGTMEKLAANSGTSEYYAVSDSVVIFQNGWQYVTVDDGE